MTVAHAGWPLAAHYVCDEDLNLESKPLCLACGQPILTVLPRHAGGRPVGSGVLPTPVLRQRVLTAAEDLWRKGETPTLRLVSFRIGIHADSLSRTLVRRGLSWTAIRNDAYRRSFGRFMSGEAA